MINRKPLSTGRVIGFGLLVFIATLIIQVLALFTLVAIGLTNGSPLSMEEIGGSGFFLALATVFSGIVGTGLIIFITRYYQGISFPKYLGLCNISWKQLGFWLLVTIIFLVIMDCSTYLLKKPIVTEFMKKAVDTSRFPWLLYFALIVAAPIFEEIFFRGFLLKGFSLSIIKPVGAVVLTALCWSLLHQQYDWYGMLQIFLGGLLFGYARLKTGSVYVTIGMHALQNLVATLETLYLKL